MNRVLCVVMVALPVVTTLKSRAALISYISPGALIAENFDSLPSVNPLEDDTPWLNDSTIPGWVANRTGSGDTVVASTGSTATGALYSFGSSSDTERALGSVGSGTAKNFTFGVGIVNQSGRTLQDLAISYVGEQWRNANDSTQTMTFEYRMGAGLTLADIGHASTDADGWTSLSSLDFHSPVVGGKVGLIDGNADSHRTALSAVLQTDWLDEEVLLLRWSDPDHVGSDHGLAIDDFNMTATAVPEPSSIAVLGFCLASGVLWRHRRRRSILRVDCGRCSNLL